jgi:hypothetical protein
MEGPQNEKLKVKTKKARDGWASDRGGPEVLGGSSTVVRTATNSTTRSVRGVRGVRGVRLLVMCEAKYIQSLAVF